MQRLILCIALIAPILMYGQQKSDSTVYSFTLQQAQKFALENNLEKKNAELDVLAAKKKVWETTAIGLPQVSGSIDYSFNKFQGEQENPLEPLFGIFAYYHPDEALPDFGGGGDDFAFVPESQLSANANVNQVVFSGEYIVALQASKTYLQLSKNQLNKQNLDVKELVNNSYYSILSLEYNKNIIRTNRDLLKQSLEESKAMYAQGLVEQTTVDQLEYNFNIIENQYNQLDRQLNISYDLFKIALGIEVNNSLELTDSLSQFIGQYDFSTYIDSMEFQLENNIDYQMLETQVRSNELLLKREKSLYLPSINAYYRYNKELIDVSVDFTPDHTIGASASIPIFASGMKNAKVQQAKIELEKSENMLEMQSENIKALAKQTQYDLKNKYESYLNEKKNFELAQKIYNNTEVKFNEGVAGSFDLTQANTQFLQATSAYVVSIVNLLNAKTQLDKINNTL